MKKDFKLIDGVFTPEEAGRVLYPLLNHKINFHSVEIFSDEIRNQISKFNSKHRIEELESDKELMHELLKQAAKEGVQLKIKSNITIEFE